MTTRFFSLVPGLGLCLLLTAAACGPTKLRYYDGPELPPESVTTLWSNPHLDIVIDRNYTVPRGKKLHKIELPAGHHVVEVKCLYTPDVKYTPIKGSEGSTKPIDFAAYTESPVIALTMEGEAGQEYKPRVHFLRDAEGVPGCNVRMRNLAKDKNEGKEDAHTY